MVAPAQANGEAKVGAGSRQGPARRPAVDSTPSPGQLAASRHRSPAGSPADARTPPARTGPPPARSGRGRVSRVPRGAPSIHQPRVVAIAAANPTTGRHGCSVRLDRRSERRRRPSPSCHHPRRAPLTYAFRVRTSRTSGARETSSTSEYSIPHTATFPPSAQAARVESSRSLQTLSSFSSLWLAATIFEGGGGRRRPTTCSPPNSES